MEQLAARQRRGQLLLFSRMYDQCAWALVSITARRIGESTLKIENGEIDAMKVKWAAVPFWIVDYKVIMTLTDDLDFKN